MRKRVLVIGSGKRAQNAILPALWCLRDTHEVVAVLSRHEKDLTLFRGQYSVTTATSLASVDLPTIDLLFIAVTLRQVPAVLQSLSAYDTSRITLFLDTPVLAPQQLGSVRAFKRFKDVRATEDTIALPPFLLAKKILEAPLKTVHFFHSGYKYHALASMKMLTGSSIRSMRGQRFPMRHQRKDIRFANGVRGILWEPRDYDRGKLLLTTSNAGLADYPHADPRIRRMGYIVENHIYRGMTLDGVAVVGDATDEKYLRSITDDIPDASPMNTMKIRGLLDLILDVDAPISRFRYDPIDAIWDNVSMLLADKVGWAPAGTVFKRLLRFLEGR